MGFINIKKIGLILSLAGLIFLITKCGSGLCPIRSITGSCNSNSGSNFNLLGILDTSFGTSGGYTTTDIAALGDNIYAFLIQSSGKIVAGGYGTNANQDFTLARYTVNGILDTTFGTAGKTSQSLAAFNDTIHSLQTYAGKIIAGGYGSNGVNEDFLIARYTTDGILDTTFGTAGSTSTDFAAGNDRIIDISVLSDGRIVATGYATNATTDFALARYTVDGILDTTFGTAGTTVTDIAVANNQLTGHYILPNGSILVSGFIGNDIAVAKYTSDGILDTTFGASGGYTQTDLGGAEISNNILVQSDGKIVVGARSGNDYAVARYTSNGILDTTFGTSSGFTVTDFYATTDQAAGAILQPDDKIILMGRGGNDALQSFGILRYSKDGILDTTFGTAGKTVTNFGVIMNPLKAISFDSTNKLLVGGRQGGAGSDFIIVRYR